jgi:DNA topoisomerase-2
MHLFDADDTLHKYEKVSDIIDAYFEVRLQLYQTRKDYMIDALERDLVLLSNKAKYIQENLDGTIDLRKKKKDQVVAMLEVKGYDKIDGDEEYKYLVKMPMDSVTEENVERLLKEKGNKESELEIIKKTTINKMWLSELEVLKDNYLEYKEERTRLMNGEESGKKKKVVSNKSASVKKSVKKVLVVAEEE